MDALSITPEQLLEETQWLRSLTLRLAGADEADDLAQSAWLRALQQQPGRIRRLRPWLRTVARHAFHRHRRDSRARLRREIAAARPEATPSTADLAERASLHRAVVDAVLELEEPARSTVLLRFFDDRMPEEIARLQGTAVATVHTRLRRSLAILRARLDGERGGRAAWVAIAIPGSMKAAAAAGIGVVMSVKSTVLVSVGVAILVAGGLGVAWKAFSDDSRKSRQDERAAAIPPTSRQAEAGGSQPITATPYAELEAASRGEAVEVEVTLASGKPVEAAAVVIFRGEKVLLSAKTDRAGIVRMTPSAGEARVVAVVPGAEPLLAVIPMTAGRTRLAVPDGLEISGVVQLQGRPPPSPVRLDLSPSGGGDAFDFELPYGVRAAFDFRLPAASSWQTETDEQGRFTFIGLPLGFEGHLWADLPYEVREIRDRTEKVTIVRAPTNDVVISVDRLPVISGRVVDATTGEPIPGAPVDVTWEAPPGTTGFAAGSGMQADRQGRFEVTVQTTVRVVGMKVAASARDGTDVTEVAIKDRFDEDHDVGDVRVDRGRLVRFVVKDEAGQPVPDARAIPGEHLFRRESITSPTDSAGRSEIWLTHQDTVITVGAFRYDVATVPVPANFPGVLEVTLSPAASVTITTVAGGAPAPGMRVNVRARKWIFPGSMGNPMFFDLVGGMTAPSCILPDGGGPGASFLAGTDGVVRLSIPVGVPIRIEVVDQTEAPRFSEEITLAKGESKGITVTLATAPRAFSGVVADSTGNPLSGATVLVAKAPKDLEDEHYPFIGTHVATTDRRGKFSFKDVVMPATNVKISKPGYVTRIEREVPIPEDGAEARFTLAPAKVVRAFLVDSSGSPVNPPLEVIGQMAGFPPRRPRQEKPGVFLFDDCGAGSLTVRARIGNGTWTTTVDTASQSEARVVVPVLGRLDVSWSAEIHDPSQPLAIRAKPGDASTNELFAYLKAGTTQAGFDLVVPGTYSVELMLDPRKLLDATNPKILARGQVTVVEGQEAKLLLEKN